MRAVLRHARVSPKKAALVASMVRAMKADQALHTLERLPKKSARLLEALVRSALANAQNNAQQNPQELIIKKLTVTKGPAFQRYIPMARGRARKIQKFTSHITVELGVDVPEGVAEEKGVKAKVKDKAKDKNKDKDDSDVVYSESKPQAVAQEKTEASAEGEVKSTAKEEHGGSTFQEHRQGGRGA